MRTSGVVQHPIYQAHNPGSGHPERPDRIRAVDAVLNGGRFGKLARVEARPVEEWEVRRVHSASLLQSVHASAGEAFTAFDADTSASAQSYEAARLAAGGAIELADAIVAGDVDNGFAAVRPPGHHAEADRVMGFCFFNNVAVVARHLLETHSLGRVAIVDWDVHHGNGTQNSFYDDDQVMYVSTHQYPFYPGSGGYDEIGIGKGTGSTVNVPMAAGSAAGEYDSAFAGLIAPVLREFRPEFVIVSAGFDAHHLDPLASIGLDENDFARMARTLVDVADETASGRIMMVLEGGYDLDALARSVAATLGVFTDPKSAAPSELGDSGELAAGASCARDVLKSYWTI